MSSGDDQNMPLKPMAERKGQAQKRKQSIMPLIGKRKFTFSVNEEKLRELMDEKCRRYRPRAAGTGGRSSLKPGLSKLDSIVDNFKLVDEGVKTIRNIPDELLPRHKKEAALLAKQKEQVYAKPEHWLVNEKKIVTTSEMAQMDKARIGSRLGSMKQFSRAANILNMVAKPGETVGPVRKKRSPVFDGLMSRK